MPELPARPDLGQLRRQAHELLRAATDGQQPALARLRAVSDRIALSTAQLALAREYGFPSWTALTVEVRRIRSGVPADHWSLGGGSPVNAAAGVLHPGIVRGGSDRAVLYAQLVSVVPPYDHMPVLSDITVTDEHGSRYLLVVMGLSIPHGEPARLRIRVYPVPPQDCGWLELRGKDGSVARLVPSGGPAVSVGPLEPLTELPAGPRPREDDPTEDGPGRYLDVTADLPRIDGTAIRLESLGTDRNGWRLSLRATPTWWFYDGDGTVRRWVVAVAAQDDRGRTYVCSLGGGADRGDHEEADVLFQPALDPLARAVTVTFRGTDTQVAVRVDLGWS